MGNLVSFPTTEEKEKENTIQDKTVKIYSDKLVKEKKRKTVHFQENINTWLMFSQSYFVLELWKELQDNS